MNGLDAIALFKALSEETRYRIIEALLDGEKCACELPKLIKRTQSNTSMHLAKLSSLGILQSRRNGKMVLYSIKDVRACKVLKALGHPHNHLHSNNCCNKSFKVIT